MIYLASPYSHSDPAVRQARFDAAKACGRSNSVCSAPCARSVRMPAGRTAGAFASPRGQVSMCQKIEYALAIERRADGRPMQKCGCARCSSRSTASGVRSPASTISQA